MVCTILQILFLSLHREYLNNNAKLQKNICMANKSEEKKQKMTLLDYYENLPKSSYPKKDFIQRIMSECDVSFTTARNWTKGHTRPMVDWQIKKLSEITGIPKEQLWQ